MKTAETRLPTRWGMFRALAYQRELATCYEALRVIRREVPILRMTSLARVLQPRGQ